MKNLLLGLTLLPQILWAANSSMQEKLLKSLSHSPEEEAGYAYFGTKATLKFQDMKFGDAVKEMARIFGFDAVVDKEIQDHKVSIEVQNMPWDAALFSLMAQAQGKCLLEGKKLRFSAK